MSTDVTIAAALFAGLLSFLSPCVLPLVPPYLVYLAGASLERFADAEPEPRVRRETVLAALLFVAGFSTVFVAFGASATLIGKLVLAWSNELTVAAGIVIIVMGLHFLGLTPIAFLMREKRMELAKPVGLWGAYVMGLCFAFGWTPCIGPILATILAIAASRRRSPRAPGCSPSIRRGSASRSSSRRSRSSPSRHSSPGSSAISAWSRRPWARSWCSPASRSRSPMCWRT